MTRLRRRFGRRLLMLGATLLVGTGTIRAQEGFSGCAAAHADGYTVENNADRLFTPASVLKIIVTTAALHELGSDFRTHTRVAAEGSLADGVLTGDLVWVGAGDPTWNRRFFKDDPRRPIRALIDQLRNQGLRRVSGDLVIDIGDFPGRPFPATRALNEMAFGFAAPTSALAVDENTVAFVIAPGKAVGSPATIRLKPRGQAPEALSWSHRMITAPHELDGRGTVDIQPSWDGLRFHLKGEYPISEPAYSLDLAVPDGDLYAGEVVRQELTVAGIRIDGEVRLRRRYEKSPRSTARNTLATLPSLPIKDWLRPILQDSHNWYAEMLLRRLALERTGEGRWENGLDVLEDFLQNTVGIAPDSFRFEDASGISPYNLISPRAVTETLLWARNRPWSADFENALPTSKTGTLEIWPTLPRGTVAKTGTLRHTLALAGYTRLGSERPLAFACFLGHRLEPRPALRTELVERVRQLSAH